jgi:hypothetical protein
MLARVVVATKGIDVQSFSESKALSASSELRPKRFWFAE